MKILAVTDKKGRVQWTRMQFLASLLGDIDVVSLDDKFDPGGYDAVYYAHFSLFSKRPCSGKRILASVTSHKCLDNKKKTIKELRRFDAVSFNNKFLYNTFKDRVSVAAYVPNGVDANTFCFCDNNLSGSDVFGWVGNKDRATKNYKEVLQRLIDDCPEYKFNVIATSKSDNVSSMLSVDQMVEFYHGLDFFLVTSSTEGTPNPALEALACGIPVVSTRVGNMVDIVVDGVNGFLVDDHVDSFKKIMSFVSEIDNDKYIDMSRNARQIILDEWDWAIRVDNWRMFFNE
jgi:glycosyltransferase involved in cell wall biosynthesis